MTKPKHIVYLMLENRSLDNLLGWLYQDGELPNVVLPTNSSPKYDGLKEGTHFNMSAKGEKKFVVKGTNHNMNVPSFDPYEEYKHINNQLFESEVTPNSSETPTMGGFYKDYEAFYDNPDQIMQTYTPEEIPVLNGLARKYAVSDRYFASVPTQTNCNRAFAACGNSLGINDKRELEAWVNNRDSGLTHAGEPTSSQFNQRTMWNVLAENGLDTADDWMLYNSTGNHLEDKIGAEGYSYTRDLMEQLQGAEFDLHFDKMDTFLEKAKAGTLPKFSFLEPEWGLKKGTLFGDVGINGNDYHPPTNLAPGEVFLKQIYEALTSNKESWEETLFIINFDEHGGTYDHVSPPWNAETPWSNGEIEKPLAFEGGFKFNRFGVRVPLIVASAYVQESTVFRAEGDTPFDHTSVIATILTLLNVPRDKWKLGGRVANAPTFENILLRDTPRTDIPEVNTNSKGISSNVIDVPQNDIQMRMVKSILNKVSSNV